MPGQLPAPLSYTLAHTESPVPYTLQLGVTGYHPVGVPNDITRLQRYGRIFGVSVLLIHRRHVDFGLLPPLLDLRCLAEFIEERV